MQKIHDLDPLSYAKCQGKMQIIAFVEDEEVSLWGYQSIKDVWERIPYFIEDVYNQKRLHSSLGYRPPCEFEAMVVVTQNPCQRALISSP